MIKLLNKAVLQQFFYFSIDKFTEQGYYRNREKEGSSIFHYYLFKMTGMVECYFFWKLNFNSGE